MRSHSDIVRSKSPSELAAKTGTTVNTVNSWARRDSIPPEHWPAFIDLGAADLAELAAGVRPRVRRIAA